MNCLPNEDSLLPVAVRLLLVVHYHISACPVASSGTLYYTSACPVAFYGTLYFTSFFPLLLMVHCNLPILSRLFLMVFL